MEQPVLSIQGLAKSYGKVKALNGIAFDVPKGSIYGVLGPNGSGKTTLLSIVLDVLKADAGSFLWQGQPSSPQQRKQIGALLETPNFYHYLSAYNNLKITAGISQRGNLTDIDRVLQQVKLLDRKHSKFSTFSLGMKQRLAIAAALLGGPPILVLDEPTNGLDPEGIAEIRQLILDLNRNGFTIIMASHLLDEVEKLCTHVAILKKGQVLVDGPVCDVLADEDVAIVSAADSEALMACAAQFPGVKQYKMEGHQLFLFFQKGEMKLAAFNAFCFERGVVLSSMMEQKKKLETRFFELTNNQEA